MEVIVIALTIFIAFCVGFTTGEAYTLKYVNTELRKVNETTIDNKR